MPCVSLVCRRFTRRADIDVCRLVAMVIWSWTSNVVNHGQNVPVGSTPTDTIGPRSRSLQHSWILWRRLIGSGTRACCTNLHNVGSRRPVWPGSKTTYPTDTSLYKLTAANLSQSPFLQECLKDLTSALYSLLSSLMTYHVIPNLLQLNFMLMMPSYTNCTPDAKNYLSCRCRMRLRQQKTGLYHGMDDSDAQKQKWSLLCKTLFLFKKWFTSRTRQ